MLAVTIIVIRIFAAMGQFIGAGTLLLTDIRAVHDIDAMIRTSDAGPSHPDLQSAVQIERMTITAVHFGYPGREKILENFSFQFLKGCTYAVVGPSGSGKSTLADIMLGLLPPDHGAVTVNDGQMLRSARARLLLVEQQPKIFSTSIRENLLMGFEAPDEKLWEALRLVDLEHTVRSMGDGLSTVLSYQGENLSGGQRQRIGIARALVRSPDLLILDEATSALDAATRTVVLPNVRRHMRNGILVMITHDPHLAEMADTVLDFQQVQAAFVRSQDATVV